MSRLRAWVAGGLAWLALVASAQADAMSSASSGNSSWTYFVSGNDGSGSPPLTLPSLEPNFSVTSTTTANVASSVPSGPSASGLASASNGSSSGTSSFNPNAVDGFINFGSGPYPEMSALTSGTPAPWYDSPSVLKAFGGQAPDAAQQSSFTSQVLSDVKQTFALAGMTPTLTTDPSVAANHTISVVSGLSYTGNSNAIGITDVGNNGFGFIDKLSYANNPTDLAWAVAHNVSHELMHAFGVGSHPDQTGQYIDAATATWSLLINPNATFSPGAYQAITATNFGATSASGLLGTEVLKVDGAQELFAAPVPEPSTVVAWSMVLVSVVMNRRRTTARRSA